MRSITVWIILVTHEDKTTSWEHNHIEHGHSNREYPYPINDWQKKKWNNQKWKREHAYLINGVVKKT